MSKIFLCFLFLCIEVYHGPKLKKLCHRDFPDFWSKLFYNTLTSVPMFLITISVIHLSILPGKYLIYYQLSIVKKCWYPVPSSISHFQDGATQPTCKIKCNKNIIRMHIQVIYSGAPPQWPKGPQSGAL